MRRLITLTLSVLLSCYSAYAKGGEGQDITETANPNLELMRFAGNIHQFNSIFPQEKVYLQFDNTSYYTGETIWFKAFVVNASTLKRAESKVLYVDLMSPTGVLLKQQKLKIVAGQADGSFVLKNAVCLSIPVVFMRFAHTPATCSILVRNLFSHACSRFMRSPRRRVIIMRSLLS